MIQYDSFLQGASFHKGISTSIKEIGGSADVSFFLVWHMPIRIFYVLKDILPLKY